MLCLGRREHVSQRNVQQMKETLAAQALFSTGLSMQRLIFSLGLERMHGH